MNSASDLTARARIRDAAVDLFGREGFARARVRDIADLAGVSPGLVLHHFGSKDGLREECDQAVSEALFRRKGQLAEPAAQATASIRSWLDDVEQFRPMLRYISRMLTDGSPAGGHLFAAFVRGTRQMIDEQSAAGIIRDLDDPEIVAAYLTAFGLAPILLQEHLAAALGESELTAELSRRSTLPILDLYTHGLYTDDRFLQMARDALGRSIGPRSDKGDGDPNQDPDPPAAPADRPRL